MPDKDLRRQVLDSGKTVSRKAASREGSQRTSRTASAQNSRHSSRNASRPPSDDEDPGFLSDDTALSIGSFDDADNIENENTNWPQELSDIINDILDRKRSSTQGREETYAAFNRLAKCHYIEDQVRSSRLMDLLAAFCRSIKYESSERETVLALRALELLAITAFDDKVYEHAEPPLTRAVRDSTSTVVKAAAIHCLGTCTLFGGAGNAGILDQMSFFLDIIASDGQTIDAADDAGSVTAALQEWGFLATEIEDLESESEDAVQIFMDQLNSSVASVQIAAGEAIALLYEKSYTPQEEDEESDPDDGNNHNGSPDSDSDDGNPLSGPSDGPKLIKRYNAYHNTHELASQLHSLASIHSKRISKRDKKSLHSNFASILTTVENPRRGPMYNTAIDQHTNRHYGSKLTVKIGRQGVMNIDRWWKWIRLNALRRVLQGGFVVHYFQGNRAVLDSLPVMVRQDPGGHGGERGAARKAAKARNSRRWQGQVQEADDEGEDF